MKKLFKTLGLFLILVLVVAQGISTVHASGFDEILGGGSSNKETVASSNNSQSGSNDSVKDFVSNNTLPIDMGKASREGAWLTSLVGNLVAYLLLGLTAFQTVLTVCDLFALTVPATLPFLLGISGNGQPGFKSAVKITFDCKTIIEENGLLAGAPMQQQGGMNPMSPMGGMGMNPMSPMGGMGMRGMNPMGGMGGMGMNPMSPMGGMGMNPMGGMNGQQMPPRKQLLLAYFKKRMITLILLFASIIIFTSTFAQNCGFNLAEGFFTLCNKVLAGINVG